MRNPSSSRLREHQAALIMPLIAGVSNLQVAVWIEANCDFDQLILEYWTGEANSGWIHCSYVEGSNRKQVLRYDGKTYENGLPDMKWSGGKVAN